MRFAAPIGPPAGWPEVADAWRSRSAPGVPRWLASPPPGSVSAADMPLRSPSSPSHRRAAAGSDPSRPDASSLEGCTTSRPCSRRRANTRSRRRSRAPRRSPVVCRRRRGEGDTRCRRDTRAQRCSAPARSRCDAEATPRAGNLVAGHASSVREALGTTPPIISMIVRIRRRY